MDPLTLSLIGAGAGGIGNWLSGRSKREEEERKAKADQEAYNKYVEQVNAMSGQAKEALRQGADTSRMIGMDKLAQTQAQQAAAYTGKGYVNPSLLGTQNLAANNEFNLGLNKNYNDAYSEIQRQAGGQLTNAENIFRGRNEKFSNSLWGPLSDIVTGATSGAASAVSMYPYLNSPKGKYDPATFNQTYDWGDMLNKNKKKQTTFVPWANPNE